MSLGSIFKSIAPFIPIVGPVLSAIGQRQTNKANTAQAAAMMSFQERMSGTSYQRGVADMEDAGLNPMLAYSQGGASTPGGAQATMGNELGEGVQGAMLMAQMELTSAQAAKTRAEEEKVRAEIPRVHEETKLVVANTAVAVKELDRMHYQMGLTEEQIIHVRSMIWNNNLTYKKLEQEVGTARADRIIRELEIEPARRESNYARETGMLSPILRDLSRGASSAGAIRDAFRSRPSGGWRTTVPGR